MIVKKMHRLGRGLSELIPENLQEQERFDSKSSNMIISSEQLMIPVSSIKPSSFQPRREFDPETLQELATSIKENGLIQPVILRKSADNDHSYELVAGERRWRASIMAKIDEIPSIVKNINDKTALEMSIIENIQREDLNPVEEAESYKRLMEECLYTHENLSTVIGKSRSHVTNMLRILNLSERVLNCLRRGDITVGHARALIKAEDTDVVLSMILKNSLSVRQTENLLKEKKTKKVETKHKNKTENIQMLERALSDRLGLKIEVNESRHGGKGSIVIKFDDPGQLEDIMNFLSEASEKIN